MICTLAIQTASIRLAFSMARDNALPFGDALSHVSERRQSPVAPALVSGLIAIGLLLLNAGNAQIFLVINSVSIVVVYIAYLLVTAPLLRRRLADWPDNQGEKGWFFLGRVRGIVINSVAVGGSCYLLRQHGRERGIALAHRHDASSVPHGAGAHVGAAPDLIISAEES